VTSSSNRTVFPQMLGPDLWVLGNYFFNLYLVRGERASALVEVGVSAVVDTVIDQLEELEIVPDYLVLTHPHADHFTGLRGLRERYPRAAVVAAEGAREFVLHPKAVQAAIREDRFIGEQLAARGLSPRRPSLTDIIFPEDVITVSHALEIDLGGTTASCLPVKGHSPASIAVHVPVRDALVLSDSLGFYYPGRGFCPLFFTGYHDFLATLDHLSTLKPAIVGPAHQGPITGTAAHSAIADARRAAVHVYDRIVQAHRNGRDISAELFDEYYCDEFTLYTKENINNCMQLLVRRALEAAALKSG
jgi:glyoxylase-like metal-dependent hydrolase (beta-lactamase superfamily II)